MTDPYILIIQFSILIVLLCFVGYFWGKADKRKRKRFDDREDLTTDQIYENFFKETFVDKKIMVKLWNHMAWCLELPREKLRPSDRFDVELAPEKGYEYDDPTNVFIFFINKEINQCGYKVESEEIKSIYDYILLFCKLVKVGKLSIEKFE